MWTSDVQCSMICVEEMLVCSIHMKLARGMPWMKMNRFLWFIHSVLSSQWILHRTRSSLTWLVSLCRESMHMEWAMSANDQVMDGWMDGGQRMGGSVGWKQGSESESEGSEERNVRNVSIPLNWLPYSQEVTAVPVLHRGLETVCIFVPHSLATNHSLAHPSPTPHLFVPSWFDLIWFVCKADRAQRLWSLLSKLPSKLDWVEMDTFTMAMASWQLTSPLTALEWTSEQSKATREEKEGRNECRMMQPAGGRGKET